MIEAILDRTLVQEDPQKEASKLRVQAVLKDIAESLEFEQFISELVEKTGADRSEIEDRFWELLDNGEIRLSSDFIVKLRAA